MWMYVRHTTDNIARASQVQISVQHASCLLTDQSLLGFSGSIVDLQNLTRSYRISIQHCHEH